MRKAKVEYKKVIALIFLKEEFEIKWLPLAWEIKYWERVRMMVVVCFKSVQKELKNDVVAHHASTEVPCCAMGVPGRAEQDWALSAAGPSQSAPAPSLGQGVRRPQPGWSRAGLPGEAGPACRPAVEPGAEAAMFGRGRSSRPCLSGSASPLLFPLLLLGRLPPHSRCLPPPCSYECLGTVWVFFPQWAGGAASSGVLPGRQCLASQENSSNASLCLKWIFCFLGRKQHDFSPFFFGANRPPNCKYQSSLDLKTDEV